MVINEIHYDPDVKTEPVEFIELFNPDDVPVDLSGWALSDGVDFTFPVGALIPEGGYLVVAEDPASFAEKFGGTAFGPWEGNLENEGEEIDLRDASGVLRDRVDYRLGFPWPIVGDPPGYSIELIHPRLDNELGGSWRTSVRGDPSTTLQTLIPDGSDWRYFKGLSNPETDASWRMLEYDDSDWALGSTPIGYGDNHVSTNLEDMRGSYTSVFLRRSFQMENPDQISMLVAEIQFDDGFLLWINGAEVLRSNMPDGDADYDDTASSALENLDFVEFNLDNPHAYLKEGENSVALQLHNASLSGSSDCWVDLRLSAEIGPDTRGPTPGRQNSVFSTLAPPLLRQVEHEPEAPGSGSPVLITVKATDSDGMGEVFLDYQRVRPGSYVALDDPNYETDWETLAMNDSGEKGDKVSGDSYFTATIPANVQQHRHLIRYRIRASDALGNTVPVPYPDDPQPNFAYFVYEGVPAWTGAVNPGTTAEFTVSADEMGRLPVYILISKKTEVEEATWHEQYRGDSYKWQGTLVYDGRVYDHIRYRMRGGVWRYAMGKNMWKFDFNRGHDFVARDNYGERFDVPWTKLNLGANIQQGNFEHRGEQGMFESVGFRLFNMAGVESPETAFVTFRIVDEEQEQDSSDQYNGDFWGMYLAVEQINNRFLDNHELGDGNLYKMENGTGPAGADGEKKNQGDNAVTDYSDLLFFRNTYPRQTDVGWWRQNFDLERYYSYQVIVQGIHHYDICCGKNYYYYNHPITGLWQVIPWDLDLTWADNMYLANGGGEDALYDDVFSISTFRMEWHNRIREVRDLLFNDDQAGRLIDEYAQQAGGPNLGTLPTILDADRAMWDYNPIMVDGSIVNTGKAGHGRFYEFPLESRTNRFLNGEFQAVVQIMKNYVNYRGEQLDSVAQSADLPATPQLTYVGGDGHPVNDLRFRSTSYSGSSPFAAMEWRAARVRYPGVQGYSEGKPWKYEIDADWTSGEREIFQEEIKIPSDMIKVGAHYRVRARFKDQSGRWGHWSQPVSFTAAEPNHATALRDHLRISELMYHAAAGNEWDYIELFNTSDSLVLDLNGVAFTDGVEFVFGLDAQLQPGQRLLVISNPDAAAFRSHYNLGPEIAVHGPYTGNLSNGGEQITLNTSAGGGTIVSFNYQDARGWPLAADGAGHSLIATEPNLSRQPEGAANYGANWRASTWIGGSPGVNDPEPPPSIVINEIAAHTDFSSPSLPQYDSNDWIELYNPTPSDVAQTGFYLSDDLENLRKWPLPEGTLATGGYVVFDEVTGFHNPITAGFGLNKVGEMVVLSYLPTQGNQRVVDVERFEGQDNDVSWSRVPDGGPYFGTTLRTPEQANTQPVIGLRVSELMYHPPDTLAPALAGSGEFIELHNPSDETVSLSNTNGSWRFSGAVSFEILPETTLQPGETLVVVPFDPADGPSLTAFAEAYMLEEGGTRFLGPYQGSLSNGGERLVLEKPQAPDLAGEPVSWIMEDEVIWFDLSPWPESADGQGASLHRTRLLGSGNDPLSWSDQEPDPGVYSNQNSGDRDTDGDGMPDAWEKEMGLDPNDPGDALLDGDGDGMNNRQEYVSGTDPWDAGSLLELTVASRDSTAVEFEFTARPGKNYRVLATDQLRDSFWQLVEEVSAGTEDRTVRIGVEPLAGPASRYYRLEVMDVP